ncbi:hypothetical protein K491DRAFT_697878 [Lophiostoma macrostomum CBS 122681]|uniref:Mid2 domain-containing protein n=1 Tax=Lophiostoma macrostomum CBS 122681 TaxID=1314788 RepID=A0A6A6SPY4_9PLEO|nr:hypothetical protein K491DRAFT_697878 [Lophiostoma macrostomum CBS 122681]
MKTLDDYPRPVTSVYSIPDPTVSFVLFTPSSETIPLPFTTIEPSESPRIVTVITFVQPSHTAVPSHAPLESPNGQEEANKTHEHNPVGLIVGCVLSGVIKFMITLFLLMRWRKHHHKDDEESLQSRSREQVGSTGSKRDSIDDGGSLRVFNTKERTDVANAVNWAEQNKRQRTREIDVAQKEKPLPPRPDEVLNPALPGGTSE